MQKKIHFVVKIAIISVYLIFLAGSVVRMTGSGMGCPDWPKCFGYYIPPTKEAQILWQKEKVYKKGNVIIKNENLLVAKEDFSTKEIFDERNWEPYTKHNYSKFNVYHTWTEYINRLISVLSGFVFLFLIIYTLRVIKTNKTIVILTFGAFLGMLFEAWLGKTVIDSVLKPSIITLHMVVGLLIIVLLLKLLYITSEKSYNQFVKPDRTLQIVLKISIILTLIQIVLGTQVRQFVDEQVHLIGFENKKMILYAPNVSFYIHRSFSILMILVNIWIYFKNEKLQTGFVLPFWILVLIGIETLTGILMYYTDFPMGTQAFHLLFGAILFGLQYYLIMQYSKKFI